MCTLKCDFNDSFKTLLGMTKEDTVKRNEKAQESKKNVFLSFYQFR